MNAEAGWYYYEGDPPDTFRRWNGARWIGVPTRLPGTQAAASTPSYSPLSSLGVFGAVFSVAGFAFIALILVQIIRSLHSGKDSLPEDYFLANGPFDLGLYAIGLGRLVLILIIAMAVTVFAFATWLNESASVSGALTADQMRRVTGGEGANNVGVLIAMILFGVFAGFMVFFRNESDGRARETKKRPGLFSVVNLIAANASRPGRPSVGPIKIFLWWAFMLIPLVLGVGALVWLITFGPDRDGSMALMFQIVEVLLGLEIISLACIAATVIAITARLIKAS